MRAVAELFRKDSRFATTVSKKVRKDLYMSKEIDILDLLPADAIEIANKFGFEFLASFGYDTEGAMESKEKQKELRRELKANNEALQYAGGIDSKTGAKAIRFGLYRNGKLIAKSECIHFLPQKEESDGEDRAD